MKRPFGLMIATTLFALPAIAAPVHERVRGTVAAISEGMLSVHTASGEDVSVTLGSGTHYLKVAKSSLDNIEPGSYIGTATKTVGSELVALEVVVFPPAMKGTGDGHYDWDSIPDTTQAGHKTSSSMTNGSVAAVKSPMRVKSMMTNGSVAAASPKGQSKQLTVTYKDGKQTILVPPTAPIVTFQPGKMSDVTKGATVFVNASKDGSTITANAVAVGTDGVNPPM